MPRNFSDWIPAYVAYANVTEAPKRMHFWTAVSTVAGALRRKVWIDLKRYAWRPSFYIVFVARPAIVAKTTTIDIGMDLLKKVPGIKFGPNAITPQALATAFAAASETFEWAGEFHPMSPLTFVVSELGSFLDLRDDVMINFLIELWDGRKSYDKVTKTSGNDSIEAPYINILAGTTPHWIAANMPSYMIGGGLSSRCIFVFIEKKERYIAYVDEHVGTNDKTTEQQLIQDLEQISLLAGPMTITPAARVWGREWYENFCKQIELDMNSEQLNAYAVRKQTHLHKIAMVLSVSRGSSLEISTEDLQLANAMLLDIEADMPKVFGQIGRTDASVQAEQFIQYVKQKGIVPYAEAYKMVHIHFPDFRDFEGILSGAVQSKQIEVVVVAGQTMIRAPITAA